VRTGERNGRPKPAGINGESNFFKSYWKTHPRADSSEVSGMSNLNDKLDCRERRGEVQNVTIGVHRWGPATGATKTKTGKTPKNNKGGQQKKDKSLHVS